MSEVAAALDAIAGKAGFLGGPWFSMQELEEDPGRLLHNHTAWTRFPLHDDGIVVEYILVEVDVRHGR
ncbi:hypothetical protein OG949_41405 (plasmid) [Streptomyces scopuliridis]|uniref:hypothetical protein n=1 Tax=Streptomyces scopuliridis TaxID=452529 RepID=UPI002DDA27F6|nr:hypothetical protein [Streptomyces scopuliridis]WSB39200.1 hypothetical protein OG949_41405 [Streptomyces scopuliridis]